MMPIPYTLELSDIEFNELERQHPAGGSNQIGRRAVAVVKIALARRSPGCSCFDGTCGADLDVVFADGTRAQYEVKGTSSEGLAWAQFKVSSQASHDILVSGQAVVLRVTKVFSRSPEIYELRHGTDFTLVPEPRWSAKPVSGGD